MKVLRKKWIIFYIMIILSSCRAVDKGVREKPLSSPLITLVGRIKSEVNCTEGERLKRDILISSTNYNNNPLAISKDLTSSQLGHFNTDTLSGEIIKIFAGVSYQGDLIFAHKISHRGSEQGYNINLSLCTKVGEDGLEKITHAKTPPAERIKFNDTLAGQEEIMALGNDYSCPPLGKVLDAKFIINPHPDLGLSLFPIKRTFYPLICPF